MEFVFALLIGLALGNLVFFYAFGFYVRLLRKDVCDE